MPTGGDGISNRDFYVTSFHNRRMISTLFLVRWGCEKVATLPGAATPFLGKRFSAKSCPSCPISLVSDCFSAKSYITDYISLRSARCLAE